MLPLIAIVGVVIWVWGASAEIGESFLWGQYKTSSGGTTNAPCPGVYSGYARMTNSTGIWFRPPTNSTSGTFTNNADPGPFSAPPRLQVVRRNDGVSWCGTNFVKFPASSSFQYQMTAYLTTNAPPPTNGQIVNLEVVWQ